MECSYILPSYLLGETGWKECRLSPMDMYFMPIDLILVMRGQLDRERFCSALADTLALFSPVAGQFLPPSPIWLGEVKLLLNDPVPIPVFWRQNSTRSPFDRSQWKDYVRRLDSSAIRRGYRVPLLQISVTSSHDSLGNLQTIIGISFAHLLGDASAFYQFLQAWSDIYLSGSLTQEKPVLERLTLPLGDVAIAGKKVRNITRRLPGRSQKLALSLTDKVLAYSPFIYTVVFKTLEYARIQFPAYALTSLVNKAQRHVNSSSLVCSIQDVLKAYLLKALNHYVYSKDSKRIYRIITIVNARRLRELSDRYFGNCLAVSETPNLTESMSLSEVAAMVRHNIQKLSPEKFHMGDAWLKEVQSINALMDLMPAFDPDALYVNDWTKNPFEKVNFGLEQSQFIQPLEVESLPVKNWCMIYRRGEGNGLLSRTEKGGIMYDVQVAIPRGRAVTLMKGVLNDIMDDFSEYFSEIDHGGKNLSS